MPFGVCQSRGEGDLGQDPTRPPLATDKETCDLATACDAARRPRFVVEIVAVTKLQGTTGQHQARVFVGFPAKQSTRSHEVC